MTHPTFRPLPLAASLCLCGFATSLLAADAALLARAPQDLVAARLVTPSKNLPDTAALDRTPVSLSWPLDAAQALDARPQVHVAESREYWIDASETELRNGIRLPLSAPGAVVRLSPHGGRADAAIAASDVQLSLAGKRVADAIRSAAGEDELRAAGMDAPSGSVAMRLADRITGEAKLAVPTARGAYLVHVYEPASPVVLGLAADRDGVAGGDGLRFRATIRGATLDRVSGLVSAPDGASQAAEFVRQADGSYVADVRPDLAHAGGPGLWEIHAFGTAGGTAAIPRDAKTAFAVSLPVARLDGNVERIALKGKDAGIVLSIGVETSIASRYGLSGVLYGTGKDGGLHPVAVAQSAAWLGAGRGRIELGYDAASLSLGAPWEVRDLRLVNQADFSLQERRERALSLK
ncbi:DUF4785 domain-containing protein [Dokdonella sp.]|uniref:DUF4785 domain-containing protein n=1 Tax=Dokdonella sp. TaxID=2291710 RepID=UPI00261ECA36|nr:DUF4785 domain-containing protein [Dokdonella sp.]